jgi:hypothetical protein
MLSSELEHSKVCTLCDYGLLQFLVGQGHILDFAFKVLGVDFQICVIQSILDRGIGSSEWGSLLVCKVCEIHFCDTW